MKDVKNQKIENKRNYKLPLLTGVVSTPLFFQSVAHADMDMNELVQVIHKQQANVEVLGMAILAVLVIIAGIALLRRILY